MAKIEGRATLTVEVPFVLTEVEARALEALAGYGADAVVKAAYEKLGRAYLEPHEAGLRSLFDSVRLQIPDILRRTTDARNAFNRKE